MKRGWLLDLYARGDEMVLWFVTDRGERVRACEPFALTVYASGPAKALAACVRAVERAGDAAALGEVTRRDFWTGAPVRVLALRTTNAETWRFALQRHSNRHPEVSWFNADLMPEQCYCYERDIFPLMRCSFAHEGGGLTELRCEDDRWALDYEAPPLRVAELRAEGLLAGGRARMASLTLAMDGRETTWDEPDGMLEGLQRGIDRLDPDVIVTDGGDAFLLPLLFTVAQRRRFALRLDREPPAEPREIRTQGRSFMSYGRMLYQAPEYALKGRWHLDRRNSFMLSHDGFEGLYEVARLARVPVQRIARRSIGTSITSVQLDMAWREGFLIPWKKTQPEAWKSARQLLSTDRGGIVYAPETGFHENVVELDFVSMYPSIMSRFNVSPETVNCPCCRNEQVPGIGYTICERREGLVSRALGPLVDKRVRYKALRNACAAVGDEPGRARFHSRQDALKWMLVCCFGYLGYRNARFGRIEAHEAVSAYSREVLLRTREICEEHGWHLLHANVDCVWIVKKDFRDEEIGELCRRIGEETRLPIALEGIYRWLAFLPSKQFDDRPVPTRYYGAFRDGSLKYRGIECRRGDLPAFVRDEQLAALEELAANAPDAESYRRLAAELLPRRAEELEELLRRHDVPVERLLFRTALSQDPEEYRGNGRQALAARQALDAGLELHAGEKMSYLVVSSGDADRSRRVRLAALMDADATADAEFYAKLLREAMNTLLWPAGVTLGTRRKSAAAKKPKPEPPRNRQLDFLESA